MAAIRDRLTRPPVFNAPLLHHPTKVSVLRGICTLLIEPYGAKSTRFLEVLANPPMSTQGVVMKSLNQALRQLHETHIFQPEAS